METRWKTVILIKIISVMFLARCAAFPMESTALYRTVHLLMLVAQLFIMMAYCMEKPPPYRWVTASSATVAGVAMMWGVSTLDVFLHGDDWQTYTYMDRMHIRMTIIYLLTSLLHTLDAALVYIYQITV